MKRFFETDHLVANLKGRSVRGGVASMATQGSKLVLQVGSTAVLARLLSPEDYGLFGMALVVTGFLGLFNDLGLSMATVQRPEITHAQVSALFWLNAALGLGIAIVTAALAPAVAWFFDEPRLTPVIATMAVAFLVGGLSVQHQALLRRQMRFGRIALLDVTALGAGIAAGIAAAAAGLGVWSLVCMQLTLTAVTAGGAWALCRWIPGRPRRAPGLRRLLGFGAGLMGFNTVGYLGKALDTVLLGWRWGAIPVGFYANARRLMQLPVTQLVTPVTQVAVPALSRIPDEPARYRAAYLRFVDKVLLVGLPGVAFLIATSDWVVAALLGPQWGESARLFAILGICALVEPLASTTGWLFVSQGRSRELFLIGVTDAAIRFGLIAAALPWGATGVAVAVAARLVFSVPLIFLLVGRSGPVRALDLVRPALAPLLAAGAVLGTTLLVRPALAGFAPLPALLLAFVPAALVGLAALLVLPPTRRALLDVRHALKELKAAPPSPTAPAEVASRR